MLLRAQIYNKMLFRTMPILILLICALLATATSNYCEKGQLAQGLICFPCKKLPFTSEEQLLTNSCSCLQNYQWLPSASACIRLNNLKTDLDVEETIQLHRPVDLQFETRQLQTTPQCDSTLGYIQYTQDSGQVVCVHCSAFKFSDGTAASSTSCNCIVPAQWKDSLGAKACICYDWRNDFYLNGNKCEYCSKLPYDGSYKDCSYCRNGFAYSILGCLNCSSVPQANGTVVSGKCVCSTGFAFSYTTGKCECDWYTQKYYLKAGVCTPCSSLTTTIQKSSCNICDGEFFYYNGSSCLVSTSVPNYNITSSSCNIGYGYTKDIFSSQVLGCGCTSTSNAAFFINGTTCLSCSKFTSLTDCTACSIDSKFFLSNDQCIYCPNLPKSDGSANSWGCGCLSTYFFNISSGKCECSNVQGYYTLANGSCFNCNNLNNTLFATLGQCLCKPGFSWSGTACVCNLIQGGYNSTKGCIVCVDMVGSKGIASTSGCVCISGYIWSSTNLKCECDKLLGFTVISGICRECRSIPNSDGISPVEGCTCQKSFFFIDNQCTCSQTSELFINGGMCNNCSVNPLPGTITKDQCITCSNAAGFYLEKNTGNCIYCPGQPFTTGIASATSCKCKTGSAWSNTYLACICSFYYGYNYDFVNGAISCTDCPQTDSCWDCLLSDGLWLDPKYFSCSICPNFPNTVAGATKSGCNCITGYIWNGVNYPFGCVCSYVNGGFSNGPSCQLCLSGTTETISGCKNCSLSKGFFLSFNNSCIYCKNISNGNATALPTILGCPCKTGFKWSSSAMSCVQTSTALCTDKQILNTATNLCECPEPYVDDPASISKCSCNSDFGFATLSSEDCADCSQVSDATGEVINKLCVCNYGQIWDPSTGICGCPFDYAFIIGVGCVDCSIMEKGTQHVSSTNSAECECNGNLHFTYNPDSPATSCGCIHPYIETSTNVCGCDTTSIALSDDKTCFSCSIPNSLGTIQQSNNKACQCTGSYQFIWDQSSLTGRCGCQADFAETGTDCLACTSVTFSTGFSDPSNPAYCSCNDNLHYELIDTTPSCVCSPPYLVAPNVNGECVCDSTISIKTDSGCFSCDILNGNGKVNSDDLTACICLQTFVWAWDSNAQTGSCTCGTTGILNKDTCYLCSSIDKSTGQINPDFPNECGCQGNLVFHWNHNVQADTFSGSCDCPTDYILTDTGCVCDPQTTITTSEGKCFKCNITDSDGTVDSNNPNACTCIVGAFVWKETEKIGLCDCLPPKTYSSDIKQCVCDSLISVDIGEGICFDCRNIENGLNTTLRTNRTFCECISPFIFVWTPNSNPKTGACQCKPNYMKTPKGSCFNCRITRGNTTTADGLNCTCVSGFSFSWDEQLDSGSCICLDPKILNPSGSRCICDSKTHLTIGTNCFSCAISFNTGGLAKTTTTCFCDAGYIFKANTTGGVCSCDTAKSIVISGKCYACSQVVGSTGAAANTTFCKCYGNLVFSWSAETQSGTCGCTTGWELFGTNATTWKCICAPNHILLNSKCVSCEITNNNLGTNKTATTCNCDPGYIFTATNNIPKCSCDPKNSIFVSGICYACSLFPKSTGVMATNTTCKCYGNLAFIWSVDDPASSSCDCLGNWTLTGTSSATYKCVCSINYILINSKCLSCEIPNNALATNKTTTTCNCDAGFVFSSTGNVPQCNCDTKYAIKLTSGKCHSCSIPNSLNIPANTTACKCITSFSWVWDAETETGICDCPSPKVITNKVCGCPVNWITFTVSPFCFDCSTIEKGTGLVNSTSKTACGCTAPFVFLWVASTQTGSCICKNDSFLFGETCLSCTTIKNSNKKVVNGNSCGCNSPYIWKSETNTCSCNDVSITTTTGCLACPSTTGNGTGAVNPNNSSACQCAVNFRWNGKACVCLAPFVYAATDKSCTCPTPYELDDSLNCICPTITTFLNKAGVCKTCASDIYSTDNALNRTACICQDTFIWQTNTSNCACNATAIVFSVDGVNACRNCDATIFAKSKSGTACTCVSTVLKWNATLGLCSCGATAVINLIGSTYKCITCNNLVYASVKDPTSDVACTCSVEGMTWVNALATCACPNNSIITSSLTCFTCPNQIAMIDKYHCGCPANNIWDDIKNECVSCDTIPSSTNKTVNSLVCGCVTGFYWDIMTLSCVANTAICTASKAVVSCMNCNSIPNTLNTNSATKSTSASFTLKIGTSVASWLAGAGTIYAKLSGFMCNCNTGFKWEQKLYRCYDAKTTLT